jgi:hypothetical protein
MTALAAVWVALYVGHVVGDLWVQTSHQAGAKALAGWVGRGACARHVATLTLVQVLALVGMAAVTGWRPGLPVVALGLAVNAVSHYWADRRSTLARLAVLVGKDELWQLGSPRPGDAPHLGTGAYSLDQAWHIGWLYITALIIGGLS